VLTEPVDDRLGTRRIEIRESDPLEEVATLGDRGERRADSTSSDDGDPHMRFLPHWEIRRTGDSLSLASGGDTLEPFPRAEVGVSVSVAQYKNFVGGEWVDASSGDVRELGAQVGFDFIPLGDEG